MTAELADERHCAAFIQVEYRRQGRPQHSRVTAGSLWPKHQLTQSSVWGPAVVVRANQLRGFPCSCTLTVWFL